MTTRQTADKPWHFPGVCGSVGYIEEPRPMSMTASSISAALIGSGPASGLLHDQRQGPTHHHPTCMGHCSRTDRRSSSDAVGQGDLQARQGDGRTLLRRCQAASRPLLCTVLKFVAGQSPVFACSNRPEHQEDRNGRHENHSARTRIGWIDTFEAAKPSSANARKFKPRQNRRGLSVVCEPGLRSGLFFFIQIVISRLP